MNETAASLWQLVQDDRLVRRGAYACGAVVWFAAAWADLKILLMVPLIAGAVYVLRLRRLDHQRLRDDQREVDRRRVEAVVHQALRDVERRDPVLAFEAAGREY